MREGAYEICPKHGAFEPCDDSPGCGECRDDRLSTLSARVVEAAVERKRRRDAWMVCREPGDGSSPKYVAYTEAIGELDAAVDALIAERQR